MSSDGSDGASSVSGSDFGSFAIDGGGECTRQAKWPDWPGNVGGEAAEVTRTLTPDDGLIDRYGSPWGKFFSPPGTPLEARDQNVNDLIGDGKLRKANDVALRDNASTEIAPVSGSGGNVIQGEILSSEYVGTASTASKVANGLGGALRIGGTAMMGVSVAMDINDVISAPRRPGTRNSSP